MNDYLDFDLNFRVQYLDFDLNFRVNHHVENCPAKSCTHCFGAGKKEVQENISQILFRIFGFFFVGALEDLLVLGTI